MSSTEMTKKPFPWKCSNCKEKAVRAAVVDHVVEVEHDGRTYTVKVAGLKTPRCTKCGAVSPDDEANEAITQAFLQQAKLLTPHRIRREREGLGLTQKQLATALGVAEATISRWENGAQIQQRSLDNLLRIFFSFHEVRKTLMEQSLSEGDNDKTAAPLRSSA